MLNFVAKSYRIFCNFAQLGRFHKSIEECTTKEDLLFHWFLNSWMYSDTPSEIENVPEIKELVRATRVANFTQDKYQKYQRDMRNERDIQYRCDINFNNGMLKGLEEGRAEGREEGTFTLLSTSSGCVEARNQ